MNIVKPCYVLLKRISCDKLEINQSSKKRKFDTSYSEYIYFHFEVFYYDNLYSKDVLNMFQCYKGRLVSSIDLNDFKHIKKILLKHSRTALTRLYSIFNQHFKSYSINVDNNKSKSLERETESLMEQKLTLVSIPSTLQKSGNPIDQALDQPNFGIIHSTNGGGKYYKVKISTDGINPQYLTLTTIGRNLIIGTNAGEKFSKNLIVPSDFDAKNLRSVFSRGMITVTAPVVVGDTERAIKQKSEACLPARKPRKRSSGLTHTDGSDGPDFGGERPKGCGGERGCYGEEFDTAIRDRRRQQSRLNSYYGDDDAADCRQSTAEIKKEKSTD